MKALVTLNNLSDINEFCKRALNVPGGVTVSRGKFVVDGSSYMGVLSINPTEPVVVEWKESEDSLPFDLFVSALSKIG